MNEYEAKDPLLFSYKQEAQFKLCQFPAIKIKKIPGEQNEKDDALAKMVTMEQELQTRVMYEIRDCPSVPGQLVAKVSTVANDDLRKPIIEFLQFGIVLKKMDSVRKRAARLLIIDDSLFKKGFNLPYLKCLGPTEAYNTLR